MYVIVYNVLKVNIVYTLAVIAMYSITLHYITISLFHTPFTPKVVSGASTKLCTTVSISQCEQMSVQLPFFIYYCMLVYMSVYWE